MAERRERRKNPKQSGNIVQDRATNVRLAPSLQIDPAPEDDVHLGVHERAAFFAPHWHPNR